MSIVLSLLAVQFFVRGLTPKLAQSCHGDAEGKPFTTLQAVEPVC